MSKVHKLSGKNDGETLCGRVATICEVLLEWAGCTVTCKRCLAKIKKESK